MSLLNTSLTQSLLTALNRAEQQQQLAMVRLSTGMRINSARDDPAGLIALTALQAESAALAAAGENAQRADALLATADAALGEVGGLLTEIEALTLQAANDATLTESEKSAIQAQIDSAVNSVDRILSTAEFSGKRLFGGTLAYRTSGVTTGEITDVAVFAASPAAGATAVTVEVSGSAELAQLTFSGAGLASGNDVELQVTGSLGAETVSLAASSTIGQIASAVNASTQDTGVSAVASGGHVYFYSTEYGSDQFISVEALEGDFDLVGGSTTDYGADATVHVNGASASVDGLHVTAASGSLSVELDITEALNGTTGTSTFTITGGGATFALGTTAAGLVGVGLPQLTSGSLGSASLGYLSSVTTGGSHEAADDAAGAAAIVARAREQVSTLRGRIGATQRYVIGAASNNIDSMLETHAQAASIIGDADYARTIADLTRAQITGTAILSALALANGNATHMLNLLL